MSRDANNPARRAWVAALLMLAAGAAWLACLNALLLAAFLAIEPQRTLTVLGALARGAVSLLAALWAAPETALLLAALLLAGTGGLVALVMTAKWVLAGTPPQERLHRG